MLSDGSVVREDLAGERFASFSDDDLNIACHESDFLFTRENERVTAPPSADYQVRIGNQPAPKHGANEQDNPKCGISGQLSWPGDAGSGKTPRNDVICGLISRNTTAAQRFRRFARTQT